ncbi:MAG: sigma-70 family RNA polymerase sigma factor [Bacteroidota bacterium]
MQRQINQQSDQELWESLRGGSKVAFSILYKRHIFALFTFGLKFNADKAVLEDTLQELFYEYWTKRVDLPSVANVKVYFLSSLRYKLIRKQRDLKKSKLISLEDLLKDIPEFPMMDSEFSTQRKLILKEKINQLPTRQREIIHLRYYHNLSNEDIAKILEMNYQSVANLLHRALKNLKSKVLSN